MQHFQPVASVQSYQCLSYKTQSAVIINMIIWALNISLSANKTSTVNEDD